MVLISVQHKFVFIHIYKNGGSSVRDALAPYCENIRRDRVLHCAHTALNKIMRLDSKLLREAQSVPNHFSAKDLHNYVDDPSGFYKFAFVRNPWDAQVSHYLYGRRTFWSPQYKIYRNLRTFEEYIYWRMQVGQKTQKSFIYDGDNCLVDFVGKLENINDDFRQICDHLEIEASLGKVNFSERSTYSSYYNAKTAQIVEKLFTADIEMFGYEF